MHKPRVYKAATIRNDFLSRIELDHFIERSSKSSEKIKGTATIRPKRQKTTMNQTETIQTQTH